MQKPEIALVVVLCAAFGWQDRAPAPALGSRTDRAVAALKEELMTLEYTPAVDEAAIKMKAESEDFLESVEIRDPRGRRVFEVGGSIADHRALSGFVLETQELTLRELSKLYLPGEYDIQGRTMDGRRARGAAELSLDLLPEPIVLYPAEGAVGVPTSFVARWAPDPDAIGYRVCAEQGENDGLVVELPQGSESLVIPPGVLQGDKETFLEVGAIGPNGNSTLIEVEFRTL